MRIRLLILTLLIIGVHQHIQAQYMLGPTGMMNIPTADRQKPGTVMLGGNYGSVVILGGLPFATSPLCIHLC